jgi:hypothetical protein
MVEETLKKRISNVEGTTEKRTEEPQNIECRMSKERLKREPKNRRMSNVESSSGGQVSKECKEQRTVEPQNVECRMSMEGILSIL